MHTLRIDALENNIKKFDDTKNDFGDAIATRLAKIEAEANFAEGRV